MKYLPLMLLICLSFTACSRSYNAEQVYNHLAKTFPLNDSGASMDDGENIGRPGGPVSAYVFFDKRVPDRFDILTYESAERALDRKQTVEKMVQSLGVSDYYFAHRNILLVVPKAMKPELAAEYKKALETL